MTPYTAVSIVEGYDEVETEDEIIEAWQYLINTGIVWQLQGSMGRMASQLIESGVCSPGE